MYNHKIFMPCPVEQSVASLIADPGVVSLITVQPHTLVEIDHEIFSKVKLLPLIQELLIQGLSV